MPPRPTKPARVRRGGRVKGPRNARNAPNRPHEATGMLADPSHKATSHFLEDLEVYNNHLFSLSTSTSPRLEVVESVNSEPNFAIPSQGAFRLQHIFLKNGLARFDLVFCPTTSACSCSKTRLKSTAQCTNMGTRR